jgi:hypothetical protein
MNEFGPLMIRVLPFFATSFRALDDVENVEQNDDGNRQTHEPENDAFHANNSCLKIKKNAS